ncbi:hypothetical protein MASR2M48_24760 [Spirochaetota bacterium]
MELAAAKDRASAACTSGAGDAASVVARPVTEAASLANAGLARARIITMFRSMRDGLPTMAASVSGVTGQY